MTNYTFGAGIKALIDLAIIEEAKQRQDRMRAAGHQIPSDDEAQATLDATIHSMGQDRTSLPHRG